MEWPVKYHLLIFILNTFIKISKNIPVGKSHRLDSGWGSQDDGWSIWYPWIGFPRQHNHNSSGAASDYERGSRHQDASHKRSSRILLSVASSTTVHSVPFTSPKVGSSNPNDSLGFLNHRLNLKASCPQCDADPACRSKETRRGVGNMPGPWQHFGHRRKTWLLIGPQVYLFIFTLEAYK